jgi:hypothetical protein
VPPLTARRGENASTLDRNRCRGRPPAGSVGRSSRRVAGAAPVRRRCGAGGRRRWGVGGDPAEWLDRAGITSPVGLATKG